jgi:hypothetical protein
VKIIRQFCAGTESDRLESGGIHIGANSDSHCVYRDCSAPIASTTGSVFIWPMLAFADVVSRIPAPVSLS